MSEIDQTISGCNPSDCASCGGCGPVDTSANFPSTITLTMDDDTELNCMILTVFEMAGQNYIAVLPMDEEGNPVGMEVYLYKFTTENGEPMLDNIESDEEYANAASMFETIMEKAREDELANTPIE